MLFDTYERARIAEYAFDLASLDGPFAVIIVANLANLLMEQPCHDFKMA